MTSWDDFFKHLTDENSSGFYNNYYRHQINPKRDGNYSDITNTFFGRLARQLADINKFLAQLVSNKLPKSEVLNEKVSIDDDGLCTMDLLIERKEEDGTARKYKITVQEVTDEEESDEEESEEETTDYFTP
tara:strand:- start:3235 stop:3627 length:393 start_codon:yes stop_codon:yes gene_type:complete